MKFLGVIVGLFAVSNAAVVFNTAPAPLYLRDAVLPAVAPIAPIAPVVPALPPVSSVELSEWLAYKSTYSKVYDDIEDQFHKTIFFIIKDSIEAHNTMAEFGFSPFKLAFNEFSDFFHDELPLGASLLGLATQIPFAVPVVRTFSNLGLPLAGYSYPTLPYAEAYPGGAILKYALKK